MKFSPPKEYQAYQFFLQRLTVAEQNQVTDFLAKHPELFAPFTKIVLKKMQLAASDTPEKDLMELLRDESNLMLEIRKEDGAT